MTTSTIRVRLSNAWFAMRPVLTTMRRLEQRIDSSNRNAFQLGRDYEGAVRDGKVPA